MFLGIPWRSSSQDSMLSLSGAQVCTLVRELTSHKLHGVAKKKKLCVPGAHLQ